MTTPTVKLPPLTPETAEIGIRHVRTGEKIFTDDLELARKIVHDNFAYLREEKAKATHPGQCQALIDQCLRINCEVMEFFFPYPMF